jgi:hypothetical protein
MKMMHAVGKPEEICFQVVRDERVERIERIERVERVARVASRDAIKDKNINFKYPYAGYLNLNRISHLT